MVGCAGLSFSGPAALERTHLLYLKWSRYSNAVSVYISNSVHFDSEVRQMARKGAKCALDCKSGPVYM